MDTKQREEIKKKLIFGDILTRSVEEGYKSLRKKDKKEFSNIILTEKERFKKHKLLTQTNIFKVRNTKENKTTRVENSVKQLILDFFNDDAVAELQLIKKSTKLKTK